MPRPIGPIGVVLLQLGTPDDPSPEAVRRYLKEFLWDRRVVDVPRPLWWLILNLRILRTRPAESSRLYKKVWTAEGSPLAVITQKQADALAARLEAAYPGQTRVVVGMRYGNPSIASAVDALGKAGCDRIVGVSMYPQYAGATTGSSIERLLQVAAPRRVVPSLRVQPPYFEDAGYINALRTTVNEAIGDWNPDHIVISFHGIPKRFVAAGDPYQEHCLATARALIAAQGWAADRVTVSFQSLFGKEEWLRPYTDETLKALAGRRLGKLALLCPGFTADCLETLEEMGMTNRKIYQSAGGGEYRLIPCLNTHPAWIDALTAMVSRELQGWV